jgi:hypothetical protein
MADNTGKYNPSLLRLTSTTPNSISQTKISHKSSLKQKRTPENECSNKKKSQNLMQLKTDAENSCNQKRTPKTNAQKSVTKPHAVKNGR